MKWPNVRDEFADEFAADQMCNDFGNVWIEWFLDSKESNS